MIYRTTQGLTCIERCPLIYLGNILSIIFQKLTTFLSTFVCTEAKLEKLQGKSGKRKPAKDMLQSLSDARECQMQGFLHDTNPYSSSNLGEDDDDVSIFFNHRI